MNIIYIILRKIERKIDSQVMDYFIEINATYLFNNIEIIKNITNCAVAPVLKSNAYGHGIKEIISLLNLYKDINYVCVAYTDEAIKVRNAGWQNNVIIMSAVADSIEIDNKFQYFVYSFDFLLILLEKAVVNRIVFQVHIKLNCGMNRFGFNDNEINSLIKLLIDNKQYIKVVGIATHLPRLNYLYNQEITEQITLFNTLVKKIQKVFGSGLLIHPFSSKGMNLISKTKASCNMIRVGGALYGLLNSEQKKTLLIENKNFDLKQIMTLKAKVIMIRKVKKNDYIGYGENYQVKKNATIAIAAFGYGYGYSISLLKSIFGGYCNNQYISFAGLIGMNALFFDITNVKNKLSLGDYIILTADKKIEINAANLSKLYIGGREYAFVTMLHESIPKIIFYEK
jgi:alanine racemase